MHRIVILTFVILLGLICGCSSGSKVAKATDNPVLDVGPGATPAPIPAAEPSLAAMPINDTPVIAFAPPTPGPSRSAFTPASYTPATFAPEKASTSAAKTYTVKKGETLFSIAKTQLGSGRDWQKIAAANPGLTPATLKAGQQIAMP